jgi:glycosyltransferase involved in cell wall biosynthesis
MVKFTGVRSDIAGLMSAADLLALTSDTEGMPAVVLEAGYLGLPVVATRVGALAECVRHGETGLLIEPNDPREVASSLAALIGDPGRRKSMADAARVHVRRHFTMDVIASRFLEFYRQVIAGLPSGETRMQH